MNCFENSVETKVKNTNETSYGQKLARLLSQKGWKIALFPAKRQIARKNIKERND